MSKMRKIDTSSLLNCAAGIVILSVAVTAAVMAVTRPADAGAQSNAEDSSFLAPAALESALASAVPQDAATPMEEMERQIAVTLRAQLDSLSKSPPPVRTQGLPAVHVAELADSLLVQASRLPGEVTVAEAQAEAALQENAL